MSALNWSAPYVGLPFAPRGRQLGGVDCWGLAGLVYHRELGIVLPAHAGIDPFDRPSVAAAIESGSDDWQTVAAPAAFDLAVFRMAGMDSHVGIVVEPGRMLHADRHGTRVERYDGPSWRHRLTGFARHRARLASLVAA